jgi:hypothetical protein
MTKSGKGIKNIIGKVLLIASLFILTYATLGVYIQNQLLKHNGVCRKACITSDLSSWTKRYTNMNYLYEFSFEGKVYRGNSLIHDNPSKIGDSICVVFLESFPSINRPLSYFGEGSVNCNCN